MRTIIALGLLAGLALPAMAATANNGAPSCDTFRQRLIDAPKFLQLNLPAVKLEREPPYGDDEDVWTYHVTLPTDKLTVEIRCHNGKFDYASADLNPKSDDPVTNNPHPDFDFFALLDYAFTGESVQQVIAAANKMLMEQPGLDSISRDPEYKFPGGDFSALISPLEVEIAEYVQ
jgi:hypothetical protein